MSNDTNRTWFCPACPEPASRSSLTSPTDRNSRPNSETRTTTTQTRAVPDSSDPENGLLEASGQNHTPDRARTPTATPTTNTAPSCKRIDQPQPQAHQDPCGRI